MVLIFLSYRRTDSPQACRVYEWLTQRLGTDAIFMDVVNIPSATHFNTRIKTELLKCKLLLVLIGPNWLERIHRENDVVRMEIQTALDAGIPIFPIVCSNAAMPSSDELPSSIAAFAFQHSRIVGVSLDFNYHMIHVLNDIESVILTAPASIGSVSHPKIVGDFCLIMRDMLNYHYEYTNKELIYTRSMHQSHPPASARLIWAVSMIGLITSR